MFILPLLLLIPTLYMFGYEVYKSKTNGDKVVSLIMFGFFSLLSGFAICVILYAQVNQS